jgi:hypothetical protein
MMRVLLLVHLPLLFLFRRHMMADSAAPRGTHHAMVSHMAGDTADNGALDTALRLGWDGRAAGHQRETSGSQ